ncbi:hypothetical protein KAW18_16690 [candidate division WOR-3 bacterium]|nr:hypothetical protein [candidate division WOR-3 bacterium]MCK4529004.1 hypothetical protein [candidate division WOR-3 bacterium]
MEFLILGGLILTMDLLKKWKAFSAIKDSLKALTALKMPFGIVIILTSIGFWGVHGAAGTFQGIMGLIAGGFLILDLLKLIPKTDEAKKQMDTAMSTLAMPIGALAIIAGIIGLFMPGG